MDQSAESVKRSAKRIFRWTSQMIEHFVLFKTTSRVVWNKKEKASLSSFLVYN